MIRPSQRIPFYSNPAIEALNREKEMLANAPKNAYQQPSQQPTPKKYTMEEIQAEYQKPEMQAVKAIIAKAMESTDKKLPK